jgi:hypothetical protein
MTSQWTCPFCGKVGRRSKEHVWPQWLHDSPVAQELLRSAHGERISYGYSDLERTAGRLVAVPQSVSVAKWVPQITAPVCRTCNNGWMSRLESILKRTLAQVILSGAPATIEGARTEDIARWAVKTAMTYQLALQMNQGCFTPSDMREMATEQKIPTRSKVWIRSVHGPLQRIVMHYEGMVLPDAHHISNLSLRNNLALILVGLPHLEIVVGVVPSSDDLWLLDALIPRSYGTALAPQIWPQPGRVNLPTLKGFDESELQALFASFSILSERSAASLTGLTPEKLSAVLEEDHTPGALLQEAIDQFCAECATDTGTNIMGEAFLFGNNHQFGPEQLSQLFEAALDLISKHAVDRPTEVARLLHNLAHAFFDSRAYGASLVLARMCALTPGGQYHVRPDIWSLAGNAAWHIGAFALAADLYAEQLALAPEDKVAQFNEAESAFMSGAFERASEVIASLTVEDESTLADTLVCLRATLEHVVKGIGVRNLEGFAGPSFDQVVQMITTGGVPTDESKSSIRHYLLPLMKTIPYSDGTNASIAEAYLTESAESWAKAATSLLALNVSHTAIKAVLRKGASCGNAFVEELQRCMEAQDCPSRLPDGTEVVAFVRASAYPRHHRIARRVNRANQIMTEM